MRIVPPQRVGFDLVESAEGATAEATASAADAEAQLIAGGEDTREADATKPAADATTEEPKQAEN